MSEDARGHHKPIHRPTDQFDRQFAAEDPAEVSRIAHATATALLTRVRATPDADILARLVTFTDTHGLDPLADLWSRSPAKSLPGTLWRLYLIHTMIHRDPAMATLLYERGRQHLRSADDVVAGAPTPAAPEELVALVDDIMRGVFSGDFAVALERAAAFCRVQVAGATSLADDYDRSEPERAQALTTRALRLSTYALDLAAAAALWRRGNLV